MKLENNLENKACYVCGSEKFVVDHHYDFVEGKLSPETVSMCRRCHWTLHGCGVDWFEDKYLEKAIEIENRHREIHYASLKNPTSPLQLVTRGDIQRPDYFNKTHGITAKNKKQARRATIALPDLASGSDKEGEQLVLLGF